VASAGGDTPTAVVRQRLEINNRAEASGDYNGSVKAAVVALMFAYWMLSVAVIAIRFQSLFSFAQEPCGTGPDSPAADGLIPFAVAAEL
jgi:hypothetical protein